MRQGAQQAEHQGLTEKPVLRSNHATGAEHEPETIPRGKMALDPVVNELMIRRIMAALTGVE